MVKWDLNQKVWVESVSRGQIRTFMRRKIGDANDGACVIG